MSVHWYFRAELPAELVARYLVYASNGQYAPSPKMVDKVKVAVGVSVSWGAPPNALKYLAVGVGKGILQRIRRVLEALVADPNTLLSRVVLANMIEREVIPRTPPYVGFAHEIVSKNMVSFRSELVDSNVRIGRLSISGVAPNSMAEWHGSFLNAAALALAGLTSGLSRFAFELRAGAAQALVASVVGIGVRASSKAEKEYCKRIAEAAAVLIASLFADTYVYFPIATVHFKKPGVLGRELAEAILAEQLSRVVSCYESIEDQYSMQKIINKIFSSAKDLTNDLKNILEKEACHCQGASLIKRASTVFGLVKKELENARNEVFGEMPGEPLMGRATFILDKVLEVAGKANGFDNIVVALTGQSTGPFIRLLVEGLSRDPGNAGVHVVYTPYTYLNMISVEMEYSNAWIVPIMDTDPRIAYTAGRALAKRIQPSKGESFVLLQGSHGAIYPFLAGLGSILDDRAKGRVKTLII